MRRSIQELTLTRHQENHSAVLEAATQPTGPRASSAVLAKVLPWAAKGGLAVLDQGLISGSNFLIGILLARWLVPDQYGAYALAFSIFLLLTFLYQSLLLEPMAVFSGSAYRKSLRGYLAALVWIHVALTAIGIVALGGCALGVYLRGGSPALAGALLGVTIASPSILLFWLARRAYYMQLAPARATVGAFVYCALVLAGLFLVYRHGWLSPFSAFLLMATGALGTAGYLLLHVRATLTNDEPGPSARATWLRHWSYGRWALASAAATWIPYYMYYPLLSYFSGMTQAGQLRALMNLALPLEQTITALSLLFLPYAARICDTDGVGGARLVTRRLTLLFVSGAVVYWVALIPLRTPVFHLLYGGKYLEVAYLLPLVALETTIWSAGFGPTIVLRAMESPASVFYSRCGASAVSLLVGVPLAKMYGLWGCVIGFVLANVATWLVAVVLLRRRTTDVNAPLAVSEVV